MKPLAIELYCGSFGWGAGFVAEGFRVVGVDIEHQPYHGPVPEGCELVLQDVRTLHGAQFKDAAVIVASSPCQEFSYRAMPWKRAKALGPPVDGIDLFYQSIRIAHEASEAAGHEIPLIMENVKGAQKWIGRARWHYGSFYLWGDVPALMPVNRAVKCAVDLNWNRKDGKPSLDFNTSTDAIVHGREVPGHKNNGGSWFAIGSPGQSNVGQNPDGRKVPMNFHEYEKTGKPGRLFQSVAVEGLKVPSEAGRRTAPGNGVRFTTRDCGVEGSKRMSGLRGMSHPTDAHPRDLGGPNDPRRFNSRSSARQAASAAIARIPFPLAQHIARCFKP